MRISKDIIFLAFTLFFPAILLAQTKYEKEYRIKQEEVPEKALEFIHSASIDFSEKWYFEENLEGNSIEAKFKYNQKRYSVEFDTSGNFLDIEIKTPFDALLEKLQASIKNSLKNTYSKFKIRKMQVQYSGSIPSFADFLNEPNREEHYNIHYEIVVKGKKNRRWNLFEMTYNSQGELKKTEQIILRNTDNLEF
ncbi:MAG: hypothetical protein ACOCXH_06315 [Cyclobacteriaceae bacterium]